MANKQDQRRIMQMIDERAASAPDVEISAPEEIEQFVQDSRIPNRQTPSGAGNTRKAATISFDPEEKDIRDLQTLLDSKHEYAEIKRSAAYQRCKRKLTTRQEKYLNGLLTGKTMTTAYREAYNIDPQRSHASVFSDAWRLSQHPLIVLEMKVAVSEKRYERVFNAHQIREHVINGLLKESEHAETPAARVRAYELLGKIAEVGMFVTKTEVKHTSNDPEEMKKMLVSKLQEFFRLGASDAILIEEKKDEISDSGIQSGTDGVMVSGNAQQHSDEVIVSTHGCNSTEAQQTPTRSIPTLASHGARYITLTNEQRAKAAAKAAEEQKK